MIGDVPIRSVKLTCVRVEPLIVDPRDVKNQRFLEAYGGFNRNPFTRRPNYQRIAVNFQLQWEQASLAFANLSKQLEKWSMAFVNVDEPNLYRVNMNYGGSFYELFFSGEPGIRDFHAALSEAKVKEAAKRTDPNAPRTDSEIILNFWYNVSHAGIPIDGTTLYDAERAMHTFRMQKVPHTLTAPVRERRMREKIGSITTGEPGFHRQAAREVLHDRVEQHAAARKAADAQEPAFDVANAAVDGTEPKPRQAFVITPEREAWLKSRVEQLLKEWDNRDPNAPEGYYPRSARLHAEQELKEALAGNISLPGLSEVTDSRIPKREGWKDVGIDEAIKARQERVMLDDDEPRELIRRIITPTHLNPPKHVKGHYFVVVDSLHQMTTYIESFSHKPSDDEIVERFTRRGVRVPSVYWTTWIVHNNVKSKWKPGYQAALRLLNRAGKWNEFLLKTNLPTSNEFFAACRVCDADPTHAGILKSPSQKGAHFVSPLNDVSIQPRGLIWSLTFETPPHCSVSTKHTLFFSGDKPDYEQLRVAFKQAGIDCVGQVCHLHNYDPRFDKHKHEMIVMADRQGQAYTVTMQQITSDGRILRHSLKNYRGPVNDNEMQTFWNRTLQHNTMVDCRIWRPSGDYCTWTPGNNGVIMVRGVEQPTRSEWRKV